MRLHLPAVPGQPQTKANSTEAFTNKVVRFAEMMVPNLMVLAEGTDDT